jgi:tRNA threonylcarbamoyladenosine biosynthesis protein TsaE
VDGIDFLHNSIFTSHSDAETRSIGSQLGKHLGKNTILCFFGDLGAGKTTFIKGLASAVTGCPPEIVNSPTFTYLNIYPGIIPVYHFDLYRLKDSEDFLHMGFDDYFHADGICCIEWSERIPDLVPEDAWSVIFTHINQEQRQIKLLLGNIHER